VGAFVGGWVCVLVVVCGCVWAGDGVGMCVEPTWPQSAACDDEADDDGDMHLYMHMYIYTYIYNYINICIYIYIHMYII
jgi:hypothetical protein